MSSTRASRREVYRNLAQHNYSEWPAYSSTPLYNQSSLSGLTEDIRTVASTWFDHEDHGSVEAFAVHYPLKYIDFDPHDRYSVSTQYEMAQLFRAFLLKALHGWDHETALVEYFHQRASLGEQLGFETLPDQSTLWRTWNHRFTTDLQETIQQAARTILVKAEMAGVDVPWSSSRTFDRLDEDDKDTALDDQGVLSKADEVTEEIQRVAYPSFSLHRGESREIHANSFWDLQTYLGLRENLAANEGARSFTLESNRERTPLGHTHRSSLRELSIKEVREMYREAVGRLVNRLSETNEFYRAGTVAIDITEDDPFTGDRAGHESEIIGTKEKRTNTPINGRRFS